MRILLVLCLAFSTFGCGKKKPAQSPANSSPSAPDSGGMQEQSAPQDPDDAKKKTGVDPCEGGE